MDDSRAVDPDSHLESLRIQAAAVVAQQAALGEQELRLADRESALSRQEEQLAGRLEEQRRQLLDLQDQITEARSALRQKRASHAELVEKQQAELAAAKEATAELQRSAKGERQRLTDLRRRLIQRGRRHWQARRKEADARDAELRQHAKRLAKDRATIERLNGESELDKRRLNEAWGQFEREKREWDDRRTAEISVASAQVRDLARRAKAVAAGEHKLVADRADLNRETADRRRELEQLENRIVNARWQLLEQQAVVLRPESLPADAEIVAPVTLPTVPVVALEQRDMWVQRRAEALSRVADELADQRLLLTEQVERLLRTQQAWHADRTAALRDLEIIGSRFEAHQLDLDRRDREVQSARAGLWKQYQAAANLRLQLEAERVQADARVAERRAAVETRRTELDGLERGLMTREDNWRSLLRRWGMRRRQEIQRLRVEQEACRAERGEWVAARTVWLRLTARLREERMDVAARGLALEQMRAGTETDAAAKKRLERLERQWFTQCEAAAQDLGRLQATLKAEAARLDERSRRVRQDVLAAESRAAVLDDRAAEIEREEQVVAAERIQMATELEAARGRQEAVEMKAAAARDEAERLARLLIDTAPQRKAVGEANQAA